MWINQLINLQCKVQTRIASFIYGKSQILFWISGLELKVMWSQHLYCLECQLVLPLDGEDGTHLKVLSDLSFLM